MGRDAEALTVREFADLGSASLALAAAIAEAAARADRARGRFALALSGGETPMRLFETLSGEFRDKIPWDSTHLFWADERFVPAHHPASNYREAREALIAKVPIPAAQVHRVPVEIKPPALAASVYERRLKRFFPGGGGSPPGRTFDVIVLGVGADGHTASLFPGSPALQEGARWVRSVLAPAEAPPRRRITLTLPAINSSREAFFLSAGPEKKKILDDLVSDPAGATRRYPAGRVHAVERTVWFSAAEE
jgi:6-phosphogluconolactonase